MKSMRLRRATGWMAAGLLLVVAAGCAGRGKTVTAAASTDDDPSLASIDLAIGGMT